MGHVLLLPPVCITDTRTVFSLIQVQVQEQNEDTDDYLKQGGK